MKRRSVGIYVEDVPVPPVAPHNYVTDRRTDVLPDAREVDGGAPCRVCGGPVPQSGPYFGPWRQHEPCGEVAAWKPSRVQAVARHFGHTLTLADAVLLRFAVPLYADYHPEPVWEGRPSKPWGHIDHKKLRAAMLGLPQQRLEAGLTDAPCEDGPCAWCGVVESRGWAHHGHQWSDGAPAPLCGSCGAVCVRRGIASPTFWDGEHHAAVAEAVTGVPLMMGEGAPVGITAYAESATEATGEPWAHLPAGAVDAYRWERWGRFQGQYAPLEHREEALERAARAAREREAATVQNAERERLRTDVYGFTKETP